MMVLRLIGFTQGMVFDVFLNCFWSGSGFQILEGTEFTQVHLATFAWIFSLSRMEMVVFIFF